MRLTFRITNRCGQGCAHCAFASSPGAERGLSAAHLRACICQAAALPAGAGELGRTGYLDIAFTGGEPFLRFADLVEAVRCAGEQGAARVACTTNASWATSLPLARQKLQTLKKAGLNDIRLSCDHFHGFPGRPERTRNAFAAAVDTGIPVTVKVVVHRGSARAADILRSLEDLTRDMIFSVEELTLLPVGRARELPARTFFRHPGIPGGPCPLMGAFTLDTDKHLYPCCIPGWPRLLRIGNTGEEPLAALIGKANRNPLFRILRQEGPAWFIPFLEAAGLVFPSGTFVNRCHLCREVLEAARAGRAANDVYQDAITAWQQKQAKRKSMLETVGSLWGFT